MHQSYTKQRERLENSLLETAGRYDRAVLMFSSGALALSVTFLEKIAPFPEQWTIFIIVLAWLFLLASLILQLFALDRSENATRYQIQLLDEEFTFYFSGDDAEGNVLKGFEQKENPYVDDTKKYNVWSRWALVIGIILIFIFSATNLWLKGENMAKKQSQANTQKPKKEFIKGSYTPPKSQIPPPPKKKSN